MEVHQIQRPVGETGTAGTIVEAAAGVAPSTIPWYSIERLRSRSRGRAKASRPPAAMPHRPASPRSWRYPPPLT